MSDDQTPIPQPEPLLAPEEFIEHLRALRARVGEVTPMTPAERKVLQFRARASDQILNASIDVIDALEIVAQAIGMPAAEVRRFWEESHRWLAAENEVRALLAGIYGANLVRRDRMVFIAAQAAAIGGRLARDPAYSVLVPYVTELKRLKRYLRRRKAAPETPPQDPE